MEAWTTAFSGEHPETILALYADDAVLWGTLSPVRRDNPAAIRDYFEQAISFVERKVTFHDPLIRVFGNTSVNNGLLYILVGKRRTSRNNSSAL